MLTCKEIIRAGYDLFEKGKEVTRTGYGSKISSIKDF